MYIKPALPCLPFFVVFSINLLSKPEREWEGWEEDATERKWQSQIVTESKQKRTHFNQSQQMLHLQCELKDNLEKDEGRSF